MSQFKSKTKLKPFNVLFQKLKMKAKTEPNYTIPFKLFSTTEIEVKKSEVSKKLANSDVWCCKKLYCHKNQSRSCKNNKQG